MGKRLRVAIPYGYNENWIGGTYYIENIIKSLNYLSDEYKPELVILAFRKPIFEKLKQNTGYPYLIFCFDSGESNFFFKAINGVFRRFFRFSIFPTKLKNIDVAFPYSSEVCSNALKKIHWIPDFQEHFLPEFFNKETIEGRKVGQKQVSLSGDNLILSSNNAYDHFKLFYPNHTVKTYVLPFAVTHPDFSNLDIELLKEKYNINKPYFICSNQFYTHKNHIVVLKAVKSLVESGFLNFCLVLTGSTDDYRNPDFFKSLLEFISTNKLDDYVKFLGFISRTDQLCLLKNSICVIQPSKFEGWSTSIEDAKALNKMVIASSLDVHKEQLIKSNVMFFEPDDFETLAEWMKKQFLNTDNNYLYSNIDYSVNVRDFGYNFYKIISS